MTLSPANLRDTAYAAIKELGSDADVDVERSESMLASDIILITSSKDSNNIKPDGKWGVILKNRTFGKNISGYSESASMFNCTVDQSESFGIMQFAMPAMIYDSHHQDLIERYGRRCIKIALYSAMGITNLPVFKDTIYNLRIDNSCYTLSDKLVLHLRYTGQFQYFIEEKISDALFREEIIRSYQIIKDRVDKNCN
jgi:hypothetical protein